MGRVGFRESRSLCEHVVLASIPHPPVDVGGFGCLLSSWVYLCVLQVNGSRGHRHLHHHLHDHLLHRHHLHPLLISGVPDHEHGPGPKTPHVSRSGYKLPHPCDSYHIFRGILATSRI